MNNFTIKSQRVISYAVNAVRKLKSPVVGTEHLLAGLVLEEQGVAAKALRMLGFDSRAFLRELERSAAETAVARAAGALTDAWSRGEDDGSSAGRLAALYHRTILDHLPAAASDRVLRSSQVSGYLNRFLALERRCDSGELPGDLSRFLQAGPWLGDNLTSPLAAQVLDRYAAVLHAAGAQAVADFAAAQPETDPAAFLALPDFPVKQLLSRSLGTVYSVW